MVQTKICRYCGNAIYRDEQTCPYCGKYLMKPHDNPEMVCEKCKAPVNTDDNFCQECGAIFDLPKEEPVEEPQKGNLLGIPYNIGIILTSLAASIAITVFVPSSNDASIGGNFLLFCIAFIVSEIFLYIYFLPSILAIEKNNSNILIIYICNLLFGITVIGWVAVMILGLSSKQKSHIG